MTPFDENRPLEADDDGRPTAWLLTFSDVVALMLTFFVMLFSMSTVPSEKWETVIPLISLREIRQEPVEPSPRSEFNISSVDLGQAVPLPYLSRILREHFSKDGVLSRTQVRELDGVTVLSLQADRLFEPGAAELDDSAREAIFRLGGTLATFGNRIDVVGHAGPAPQEAGDANGAAGAWDLSLARAIAVARLLGIAGYTRELSALGQGTGRYGYIDENMPASRRAALARRVDIRIHAAAGSP